LLEQLRLWHGGLRVEPGNFSSWGKGARFYPVLYLLTRMGEARDWGTGLPLKANLLGKMSSLELHHTFPKARLYKHGYPKPVVNSLANFCFLTKDTNLNISDRLPVEYFPEIEAAHPGALASQWIPQDPELWKLGNYRDYLAAREVLLAEEANRLLRELLHGEDHWLDDRATRESEPVTVPGGIDSAEEEQLLADTNYWVENENLPRGELSFDLADPETGEQKAVLDLAWPNGIQEELSQPVALLLNESTETIAIASQAGYRCFTTIQDFRHYVESEILVREALT